MDQNSLNASVDIVEQARSAGVNQIINVGTSLVESQNCIALAHMHDCVVAAVGLHPNDCTQHWREDFQQLSKLVEKKKENFIVAIGECGLDMHYPNYNLQRQRDAFKAQVELALENGLPLVVHTRDAREETLRALEEFAGQARGVIHCFSEDISFAKQVIEWGYVIGLGGALTYPKNNHLREVAITVELKDIVLETDAPFLPIQKMRGQKNAPRYIYDIAQYLADLRGDSLKDISVATQANVKRVFGLPSPT